MQHDNNPMDVDVEQPKDKVDVEQPKDDVIQGTEMDLQYNWDGILPDNSIVHAPGLYNSRNDCFINSVLQFVFHTPQLVRLVILNRDRHKCEDTRSCFQCVLDCYRDKICKGTKSFYAKEMRDLVNEQFPNRRVDNQEDAHEMLIFLLSKLEPPLPKNSSAPKPSKPTEIDRIFGGKLLTKFSCWSCSRKFEKHDDFRELNLNLLSVKDTGIPTELDSFIDQHFAPERLDDYKCEECYQRGASRRLRIEEAPSVLVIQLERFRLDGSKIHRGVGVPPQLDLTKHTLNNQSLHYKLYGFISHYGETVRGGHYICTFLGYDKKWYEFNDDVVVETDTFWLDTSKPYLLFYYKDL